MAIDWPFLFFEELFAVGSFDLTMEKSIHYDSENL